MFVSFIIHTFQLVFSAGTTFFSHDKSAGTVFRFVFSAKRTGPVCWWPYINLWPLWIVQTNHEMPIQIFFFSVGIWTCSTTVRIQLYFFLTSPLQFGGHACALCSVYLCHSSEAATTWDNLWPGLRMGKLRGNICPQVGNLTSHLGLVNASLALLWGVKRCRHRHCQRVKPSEFCMCNVLQPGVLISQVEPEQVLSVGGMLWISRVPGPVVLWNFGVLYGEHVFFF